MSHTNRVSHMLNPRGLATSVNCNITKPEAQCYQGSKPTQPSIPLYYLPLLLPLFWAAIPVGCLSTSVRLKSLSILSKRPHLQFFWFFLPVSMAMPRSRNDSWATWVLAPEFSHHLLALHTVTSHRDAQVSEVSDPGLSAVCTGGISITSPIGFISSNGLQYPLQIRTEWISFRHCPPPPPNFVFLSEPAWTGAKALSW